MSEAEKHLNQLITVCDECGQACCWQGIFMCDLAKVAGTKRVTVGWLAKNSEESPSYWKTDEELADG